MSSPKVLGFLPALTTHPLRPSFPQARCQKLFPRPFSLYWSGVKTRRISSCSAHVERKLAGQNASLQNTEREARIRKNLQKPEFLPSSYETAWVAMVPSSTSLQAPYFPQCVEWIMQNQQENGSWGINEFASSVSKDILLSTLACVIALKKWNVGLEQIRRGLHFIGRNMPIVMDEQITTPNGFNLTFPSMIRLAIQIGLEFPVRQADVDEIILRLREMELKRLAGEKYSARETYLSYVADGSVNLLDWNEVMKFQRKNGSLFNSPSTTAAALVQKYDDNALQYLQFLLNTFGSAVPLTYPRNIHYQLSMLDTLQKLGISHRFSSEINGILDRTYRLWLEGDEEVMLDVETCAMAFRILRMNAYDVSSDGLSHVAASTFQDRQHKYLKDTKSILELYKASEIILSENEYILENIGCWSGILLKEKLCLEGIHNIPSFAEVEHALKFPFYAIVEPLDQKRNIEHFDAISSQILQTNYLPSHLTQDLLALAVEDFSFTQSIYQEELKYIDSWEKENGLDQLQFARQRLPICYFCVAATISPPELSDARIACAKNVLLTVFFDDFFDVGGSKEETDNLIELIEKWDEPREDAFHSEQVKILYTALYSTVNHLGAKASAVQNRDVTQLPVEMWQKGMRCMMTESEWQRAKYAPTVEEYMANSTVSIVVDLMLLPAKYFLGEMISDYMVKHEEYNELRRLMSTICRLLNDTRSVERESAAGKLNSVTLLALHSGGFLSIEEAQKVVNKSIAECRRELLQLVLREDSVVPRSCKELFWKHCKTAFWFYFQVDGLTSPKEMVAEVNALFNEPLKLQTSNPSLSDQPK
ncbi:ent-kaur-16-ene synthase, chloroplastic-like isoform X1 [Lolium rigidum]|uniref:ent-kaur-16-ene synthase, chloroplastic-like isoform X1 n=1 Tax=Lolium rigidum TaxID=89674 RepID=UPI001F5D4FB8|nr:ent-kaur-16-ene synthase, chloroplastic-like isoform X1 [Lolium rigidum]